MSKSNPVNSIPGEARVPYAALVGKVIELHRRQRNYTQAQLAELLDLGQSAYSRLESGHATLNVSQLQKVANAFGMTAGDLLTEADSWKARLQLQGVIVIDDKENNQAALIVGLAVLAALVITSR